jgi:hypothetical protein
MIDNNKRFLKIMKINDIVNGKKSIASKIVIPSKYINIFIEYYHIKMDIVIIFFFARDITKARYYFNDIYKLCKLFKSNCPICFQNKKAIFKKPSIIQIIPGGPKFFYQIDLTEIPEKLKSDDNAIYLMSILGQFSKFGYNFIIQNNKAETILGNLIQFINIFRKPNSIHTDNGREFRNKLFENYCKLNNII